MTIPDADLDDRLKRLGSDLDQLSRAHPPRSKSTSRSSRVPALGVIGLAAASVVGLVLITTSRSAQPPSLAPSTDVSLPLPTAPVFDPASFAGTQACLSDMEAFRDGLQGQGPAEFPDPASASFVGFAEPGADDWVRILVYDDSAAYTCVVSLAARPDSPVHGDLIAGDAGPLPLRPDSDRVVLVDAPGSSEQLGVGPGNTLYVGLAGERVTGVEATLPDGTTVAGVLSGGWFFIDATVPAGVELYYSDQITWTLDDGTTKTASPQELSS